MRWVALLALVPACVFTGGSHQGGDGDGDLTDAMALADSGAADAPTDAPPGTAFRKAITIDGDAVAETLTNFPLYIQIGGDAELMARGQTDASDVYFVGADGSSPLAYEIEGWDPDAGDLIAWVKVTIDDDNGATLFLRYGEPSVAAPPDAPGVWSEGFLTVYHMNNDPAASDVIDSLGLRDGTPGGGMNASDLVTAQLGRGLELDGNNDVINFTNPINGASTHTISGWVSQENSADNEAFVVLGTGGATRESRFLHSRFTGGPIAVGFYNDDRVTDDDIQNTNFRLVHWTYDNNRDSRIYVDGQMVDGPFNFGTAEDTQGMEGRIGNAPGGGSGFGSNMGLNGIVDEVRIATTPRSGNWIAAEFANQSDPGGFYTLGDEEPL